MRTLHFSVICVINNFFKKCIENQLARNYLTDLGERNRMFYEISLNLIYC